MGNNQWKPFKTITVAANGYDYVIFPYNSSSTWIRIEIEKQCIATAAFHFSNNYQAAKDNLFASIPGIDEAGSMQGALIRPAGHNKNLQVLTGNSMRYREVDEKITYSTPAADSTSQMKRILALQKDFDIDDASVIVTDVTGTFRLPKTSSVYDKPFAMGWPRGKRELESERYMLNAHGTFYEIGRESGYAAIRPVTTHKKAIVDYCTWRGLLVLSGAKKKQKKMGNYFADKEIIVRTLVWCH